MAALDFTKGTLVLIMVLYHWLNYFVGVQGFYYRYLRFLTPSFIFITGFLISQVYLSKYGITDPRLPRRLWVRGAKLVGLFVALNVIVAVAAPSSSTPLTDWAIYAGLNSATGHVAFLVLLPIAYLLIAAAAITTALRVFSQAFQVAALGTIGAVLVLQSVGRTNAFLELISIGLLGIVIGALPINEIEAVLHRYAPIALAYAAYLCAITIWNEVYILQIVGVCLTLAMIYMIGTAAHIKAANAVVLLGRYSLLGYIAQILILQVIHRLTLHNTGGRLATICYLGLAAALTYVIVAAVNYYKMRAPLVQRFYSAVFA
jgi:peptidoglycan/LPS O-acetylase OafA/YrhL